jgi:hypothetical protein
MAMGIGLIGGAVGAIGSIMQGNAQSASYAYQAQIAQMNANIAMQNATVDTNVGGAEGVQKGLQIAQQIGQTKATQGASGLDLNSGSGAAVRASEAQLGRFDQGMVQFNAARRAYGSQIQGIQDTAQANLDNAAASTAKTAGIIGAFSSILGGAGKGFSQSIQGSQLGMSPGTAAGDLGGPMAAGFLGG